MVAGAAAGAAPDLLLEAGHLSESVRTVQQAQQMNLQPKLLAFSDGPGPSGFTGALRKAANYAVGTTQWAPAGMAAATSTPRIGVRDSKSFSIPL